MFPDETHVKIVQQIDKVEQELYGAYRSLERLRLNLQEQWRVLPSGEKWTKGGHLKSHFSSASAQPENADAVDPVAANSHERSTRAKSSSSSEDL